MASARERIEGLAGDMLVVLPTLAPDSVDACVTDPPYGLGFMGKHWDHGVPGTAYWQEIYRVLKPGAHLVAFGGTRTFHRMACAIEDAGFEIRDTIMWLYGSGFPKSHDVSKGIDRAAGAEREVVGVAGKSGSARSCMAGDFVGGEYMATAPATDAAREWEGWGTALKPAVEPVILARKPLSEPTVAANVLRWGTGAINIDGCRIATNGETFHAPQSDPENRRGIVGIALQATGDAARNHAAQRESIERTSMLGRWPANVITDGSDEVVKGFPETTSGSGNKNTGNRDNGTTIGNGLGAGNGDGIGGDSGSAARFFYTVKADSDDRLGSKHPTVKPIDLIQYLVRLVCPRGGLVLDPFAGTGTTGEAAWREGMRAVLIEREAEYCADIRRRMALMMSGSEERARETIKARGLVNHDPGPLFGYDPQDDMRKSVNLCLETVRARMANGGPEWPTE